MEAKKRAAATATPAGEPPAKKHASDVGSRKEQIQDNRLTRARLKEFKKDALYRTVQSYRHEKDLLASRASNMRKKLRTLERIFALQESWWENFADQVSVLVSGSNMPARPLASADSFLLKILPEDDEENDEDQDESSSRLDTAYNEKNEKVKETIARAFKLSVNGASNSESAQNQLSKTLHDLHQLQADNRAFKSQNDLLEQQLDEVTEKYLETERKIERLKSPILKIVSGTAPLNRNSSEQAVKSEPGTTSNSSHERENGVDDSSENEKISNEQLANLKSLLEQSEAVVAKQHSQLHEQESRIEILNDSIRALTNRLACLSEADVLQTAPYRSLRRRNEDLVHQIERLDSYNSRYHREKLALINERTDFQQGVKADAETRVNEIQSKLTRTETDLARIRTARDDLISALNIKKAAEHERNKSTEQIKDLASIRESRIHTLEAEVKRLQDDPSLQQSQLDQSAIENASLDDLKVLVQKLQRQNASLVDELPGLEAAFTQAHEKATAKVMDLVERESRSNKLAAEKTKADEKYFSAMRAKDALQLEYNKVKTQLAKSAEWVQQLKDAEKKHGLKISSLETRVEELGVKQINFEKERHAAQMKVADSERRLESMRALVDKLNADIKVRERSVRIEMEAKRSVELENEKLKKQVEIKNLTTVSGGSRRGSKNGDSLDLEGQLQELRAIAICSVCTKNWKDTAIKVCGHVLCNDCAVSRLTSRLRKCPLCNRQFSQSDLLQVHL